MNIEDIERFLDKQKNLEEQYIKIDFKKREPVYGLFLKGQDYSDLKSKNFWRIVTQVHFDAWNKRRDSNLSRIFSGSDFSKLTLYKDSFED
jgi:hypothetical protein